MNFFGHAHFARRVSSEPRFLLGAMLPDFANMAGTRLVRQDEPAIAAGVRDHHHVDDVFHAAPTFLALSGQAYQELTKRGLGWGSARAVAHVATELFLDGVLTHDEETAERYLAAVHEARRDETLRALRVLPAEGDVARFAALFERMAPHGPPRRYREPRFVRDVMVRILAHRPRLALAERDVPELDAYLPALGASVEAGAAALLGEVRAGLSAADAEPRSA